MLSKDHAAFIEKLAETAPFIAEALKSHWEKGERYYIDTRVDIAGHRREFNRLNKLILLDQIRKAGAVEEREDLVVDHLKQQGLLEEMDKN